MEFVPHVIDGQETESASGERFASVDPWTREPWAEVALGGADALLALADSTDMGKPVSDARTRTLPI
jgi:acyl-CoA reductase-like NAD-dependent aldehyde dehydrogenase